MSNQDKSDVSCLKLAIIKNIFKMFHNRLTRNSFLPNRRTSDKHRLLANLIDTEKISYFSFIQMRFDKFSESHICTVLGSLKETQIITEVIDSGVFISFRRWFMKMFMISEHHPYTKMVFRSTTEVRYEEVKHLVNHRHMIHPFSMFCLYYEFILSLLSLFYLAYVLPADMHYLIYVDNIKLMKLAFDIIVTFAIFINFEIGYLDREHSIIHMGQKKVAKHYLKTYFFFDLLSCIPSYAIYMYNFDIRFTYWQFVKWLSLFRMVRIRSVVEALDMMRAHCGVPVELYVSLKILICSYFVILCSMVFMAFIRLHPYFFEDLSTFADTQIARQIIFDTVMVMLGACKATIAYTYMEAMGNLLISMVALVLHFWIMAKLYVLWQRFQALSEIGEDHYQQLAGYLKLKGLPPNIRKDIYCYYDFRFQSKFYDEPTIIKMLSENIIKEIPSYRMDGAVEKIKFLRLLPNPLIVRLVYNMESLYYCPADILFRANTLSHCLYFIKCGTVALHDENDVEVCHLEDNSYYGDISVVLKHVHSVTMTAVSPCKVFLLRHSILMQALDTVPEIKKKVFDLSRRLLMHRKNDWVADPRHPQRSVTLMDVSKHSSVYMFKSFSTSYV